MSMLDKKNIFYSYRHNKAFQHNDLAILWANKNFDSVIKSALGILLVLCVHLPDQQNVENHKAQN